MEKTWKDEKMETMKRRKRRKRWKDENDENDETLLQIYPEPLLLCSDGFQTSCKIQLLKPCQTQWDTGHVCHQFTAIIGNLYMCIFFFNLMSYIFLSRSFDPNIWKFPKSVKKI